MNEENKENKESKKYFSQKILDYLKDAPSPVTERTICDELEVSSNLQVSRALRELLVADKIVKIHPEGNSNIIYYTLNTQNLSWESLETKNGEVLVRTIDQKVVNALAKHEELMKTVQDSKEQLKNIYANIISLMAIFVSIFALVTVNANIAFTLEQENMSNVFRGIILMNVFIILCVIALLVATKFILINPLIKNGSEK